MIPPIIGPSVNECPMCSVVVLLPGTMRDRVPEHQRDMEEMHLNRIMKNLRIMENLRDTAGGRPTRTVGILVPGGRRSQFAGPLLLPEHIRLHCALSRRPPRDATKAIFLPNGLSLVTITPLRRHGHDMDSPPTGPRRGVPRAPSNSQKRPRDEFTPPVHPQKRFKDDGRDAIHPRAASPPRSWPVKEAENERPTLEHRLGAPDPSQHFIGRSESYRPAEFPHQDEKSGLASRTACFHV
ncbi:hypothetical protein FB451DRAFT_11671 [Mycena latifolia]|nr:hypothetical protein FB451DRAFT_11671 [Mycena latifolia]